MATPLTANQMLAALRNEGLKPRQNSGWRTHNRNHKGAWGPVHGIVIHHTAGTNSLNLCINGTSALPGPLCHAHLAKNGALTLVGHGRANHAGSFAQNAHNAVVNESSNHPRPSSSEPVDGNRYYYGIEIENLGNGRDAYPEIQYRNAVRWAAAICRAHGWSEHSVIGHSEGTTRKIDPRGPLASGGQFTMQRFRADVRAQLNNKEKKKMNPAEVWSVKIKTAAGELFARSVLLRAYENALSGKNATLRVERELSELRAEIAQLRSDLTK